MIEVRMLDFRPPTIRTSIFESASAPPPPVLGRPCSPGPGDVEGRTGWRHVRGWGGLDRRRAMGMGSQHVLWDVLVLTLQNETWRFCMENPWCLTPWSRLWVVSQD